MMENHISLFVFLLVAAILKVNHGIELPKTRHCNLDLEHFNPWKTYWIKYKVETKGITSSTAEVTQSEINCDAKLNTNDKCQYVLTVTKCKLNNYANEHYEEHEKSSKFSTSMQTYPIAFSMYNGSIGDVLVHRDEQLSILNFKKGIISAILTKKTAMTPEMDNIDYEMRTDVHGTCRVQYSQSLYSKNQTMDKDMANCHYPERKVYPYSPWSFIWNTTFIQRQMLGSKTRCSYRFTKTGVLEASSCQENHALYINYQVTRETKVVETKVDVNLEITKEIDAEPVGYEQASYRLTGIQFEFETKLDKPKENPPHLKESVLEILEKLSTDSEKPIDPHTSCHFDDLTDLLRKSADLSVMGEAFPTKCWTSKSCTDENLKLKEVLLGQVWKSALLHCNRAPCIRAFRSLVELGTLHKDYFDKVFLERELDMTFFQWAISKTYDLEIIEELLKLAKLEKGNKYLRTALSSITHGYWMKYKDGIIDDIPSTLREIVKLVKSPIRESCVPAEGFEEIDVMTAFQGISNLGTLYEFVVPNYLEKLKKCVYNKDAHWAMGKFAIQATRNLNSTPKLHDFLLEILKSPNLKHVDHVVAYYILAEKFGNAEFVKEILKILKKCEEPNGDNNLRTFIITHMRTVARTREPQRIKYAKAIREAMVHHPNSFRIIPEEDITSDGKIIRDKDSSASRGIPWDIHLDDNILIENGEFSKYLEKHFHYDFSWFHDTIKRFGYKISTGFLYDGKSDIPYGFWSENHYKLFGRNFNYGMISKLATGELFSDAAIAPYLDESSPYKPLTAFLKTLLLKAVITDPKDDVSYSPLKPFPYKLDKNIFQNLAKLHQDRIVDIPKPKEVEAIYQLAYFNMFQGVGTIDTIKEYFRLISNYKDFENSAHYWKFIEGDAIIPTMAGIPLNWTTDAYQIENGRLIVPDPKEENNDKKFKVDTDYSGLLTLKQGMHLDLPGFLNNGAQQLLSLSTSIGGTIEMTVNPKDKKFRVQVDLPQRPMQLISFRRIHSIISNNQVKDIVPIIKPTEENWCSYKFASVFGLKFCHSQSSVNVTESMKDKYQMDTSCQELLGNSHWDYTTEYIAKHKVALQFGFQMSKNEDNTKRSFDIDVKTRDSNMADKFNTMLKFTHDVKSGGQEQETKVSMPVLPTFKIHAISKTLEDRIFFKAEATIRPKETTFIEFQKQTREDKESSVPITTYTLNYTSPTDYFGASYESKKMPKTPYYDFDFKYKRLLSDSAKKSWFQRTFLSETIWEDKDENTRASVHVHRKVEDSLMDENDPEFIHRSKTTIKFPHKIYKFKVYKGPTPSTVSTFQLNCTKQDADTLDLLSFFNFTGYTARDILSTPGVTKNTLGINITVPYNTYSINLSATRGIRPPIDPEGFAIFTLLMQRESLEVNRNAKVDIQRWWGPSAEGYYPTFSTFKWRTHLDSNLNTPFGLKNKDYRDFVAVLIGLATRKFGSTLEYVSVGREGYTRPAFEMTFLSEPTALSESTGSHSRNFQIKIPNKNYSFHGELSLDFSLETELLFWHSKTNFADFDTTFYTLNISSPPAKGYVHIHEDLISPLLNQKSSLVFNYLTLTYDPKLDWRIKSKIQFEPPLETDFYLKIADNQGNLQYKGQSIDIKGSAIYKPGHTVAKLDFTSKVGDDMPTMKWNYNYPNDDNGVTITINMLDTHKDYYIFANTKLNATRLVFKICDVINCRDLDADSDHFIAKLDYSLENPKELTRTVIYNPKSLYHIERIVLRRLHQITRKVLRHNFNIPENIRKATVAGLIDGSRLFSEPFDFSFDILHYVDKTVDFIPRLAEDSTKLFRSQYYANRDENRCYYSIFKSYFDPTKGYLERLIELNWYEPGPVPDKSYVARTQLPVYWTKFNKWPLQFNPAVIRAYHEFVSRFISSYYAQHKFYYDKVYPRHALLTDSGTIYTFDNKIRHLTMQRKCPYLLIHDVKTKKFTVYYEDDHVIFLFADFTLKLSRTGKLKEKDDKDVNLPYESKDGDVKVTQKAADLVELTTPYNFKVICNIVDFHCVFYTNNYKFNQLIGLLGNNNDNPLDETKDVMDFELSASTGCRNSKYSPSPRPWNSNKGFYYWGPLLYNTQSPTLACHDIVNVREFLGPAFLTSSKIPCSLVNNYAALCAAKDVEMPWSMCSTTTY